MAVITWTDVTNHAAALSVVVAAAQTDILAMVNVLLDVEIFGGEIAAKTKLARVYAAAHFGTLELLSSSGAASSVTSERAGDLQRDYGTEAASLDNPDWSTTAAGKMFVTLCNTTEARGGLLL